MDFSFWIDTLNLGESIVHIYGYYVIIFRNIVLFCLKIFITLIKSIYLDEMQHYAAFYLGLHHLQ